MMERYSKLLIMKIKQIKWVQIPLGPTFYSYFKDSFSGEYHRTE